MIFPSSYNTQTRMLNYVNYGKNTMHNLSYAMLQSAMLKLKAYLPFENIKTKMQMKSQQDPKVRYASKSLHQLIGIAVGNVIPTAVRRNSFIVNEVSREFQIEMDEKLLVPVLETLLSTVISNSKHSCIRIKAKEYEDIIFVSVRDNNSLDNYAVNGNLEQVNLLAKKMNGNIKIEKTGENSTTILLSFPNFPKAA